MAYPTGYSRYQEVTIDKDEVDADLTDFPVYVDLSDLSKGGADIFDTCRSDGGDIRITKSDGTTQLPREVVVIDTSAKTGELHFKFTGTLSSTVDTVVRIYYNGTDTEPAIDSTYGAENVWNSNYKAVYHMQESPTTNTIDSTGNSNSGTSFGTMASGDLVDGQIVKGIEFDGSDDGINIGSGATIDSLVEKTVSCWIKATSWNNNKYPHLISQRDASTAIWVLGADKATDQLQWQHLGGTNSICEVDAPSTGSFHYIVGTLASNYVPKIYIDGSETSYNTQNTGATPTTDASISVGLANRIGGGKEFDGILDEVRIKATEDASTWISTEYSNQSAPSTFYTTSDEQGGSSIKSINGLAKASIKSRNSLAIGSIKSINGLQ